MTHTQTLHKYTQTNSFYFIHTKPTNGLLSATIVIALIKRNEQERC